MKKFTQKDFLYRLNELYTGNVQLSARKNADYANEDDPFQNFRLVEIITRGRVTVEDGLLVRMCDKFQRIANLLEPGRKAQVLDESLLDALSDEANYSMILRMYLENKQQ